MIDLQHIDLTQGRRFESILRNENIQKNNIESFDRGIHRLKKGEIPRTNNINTQTTYEIFSPSLNITQNTMNTEFQLLSYTISTDSNIPWTIMGTINNDLPSSYTISTVSNTTWAMIDTVNNDLPSFTTYHWYTPYYGNTYDTESASIVDRIKKDPFIESSSVIIGRDIKHRLEQTDDVIKYNKSNNTVDIFKRLESAQRKIETHYDLWFDDTSNILDRLNDSQDITNDIDNGVTTFSSTGDNPIKSLKKKVPFLKRVYRTNLGRTFDNTELNLDMAIAKEHFEESIKHVVNL